MVHYSLCFQGPPGSNGLQGVVGAPGPAVSNTFSVPLMTYHHLHFLSCSFQLCSVQSNVYFLKGGHLRPNGRYLETLRTNED